MATRTARFSLLRPWAVGRATDGGIRRTTGWFTRGACRPTAHYGSTTVSEARPHIRHRAVMRHSEVGDGGPGREVRRPRRAVGRHAGPRRPARAAAGLRH